MKNLNMASTEIECARPCKSLLRIRKKKYKEVRQCHQKKGNKKLGMWHLMETIKYIQFIKLNLDKLVNEDVRRKERVFALMAQTIKSRSAIQCRSHHQKMAQVYGEPLQIVAHYEEKVIPFYQIQLKNWQESLKPVKPEINFCVIFQEKNTIRIELSADDIQSY